MKHATFIFFLCYLLFGSCNKDSKSITLDCIESKIQTFSIAGNSCEMGANVKKYTFQGKSIYVFSMGSCDGDLANEVLDAECNSLVVLGGYSGNTKINGVDFSKAVAVYRRTVWER